MAGIIGAAIGAGASILGNVINANNQNQINKYNADVNRQNMIMQNAYSASAEADARAYNSPLEQMKRLTSAGVNAFTAQDMLTSNQGNTANVATPSASNAVASPVNLDFSALADALMKIDEMHFTNGQNRQAAREAMDQLLTNINNQVKMQGVEIAERQRAQERQIEADVERQATQNDWQTEEYKKDRELQREQLYTNNLFSYANTLNSLKTQRDIAKSNIGFQRWNAEEQRKFQSYWNEAQFDFQAEENEKQRQWQSDENAENRFLQNWTSESSFSVGPLDAFSWKVKDNLDQRYKGRAKDMDKELIKGFIGD